jgi:predicted nucleotidyltransferase
MGEAFPSYATLREERRKAQRERALRVLRGMVPLVAREGGRLLVFGSLVEGGFGKHSDVDVALVGIRPGRDSELAADILAELNLAGFRADVVPERFLPPSLRERVMLNGREPGALG